MFLGRSLPIATHNSIEHQVLCAPSGCLPNNSNEQLSIVSFCAAWRASLRRCQCCHCCSFSLLLSALPKTTLRTKFKQYVYSILRSQRHAASKYFNSLGFCGVEMYDFIPWATWWGISPHSQIGLLFQCSEKRMQGWNGEHLGVGVNPVPLQSKLAIVTGVPAFAVMFTKEMEIHVAQAKVLLQKESSGNRY